MKLQRFAPTLLLLSVCATAFAQNQPFKGKVDVNLVMIDATVTDKGGNQILGLGKEDFVVTENGVEQKVDTVDYFTNRRLLDRPESQAGFNVERVRGERYFVFFFHKLLDASFASPFYSELILARRAVNDFIDNEMLPEDQIAIAGFDARLKIFSDFTTNKEQLKRALQDASTFAPGQKSAAADAPEKSIMRNISEKVLISRTGTIYDAIRVLSDAMHPIAARKVMVLFSPGVASPSFDTRFGERDEFRYRPMLQSLNKGNVSVYAIRLGRSGPYSPEEETLSRVASETNGDYYRHAVSFTTPLEQIEQANNGYYMLSYYVQKPKDQRGYQKVDVKLRNPEFRIKARPGYPFGE